MQTIKTQAEIAMDEADVFVVSEKKGSAVRMNIFTRILYKTHKPVILAVNKIALTEMRNDIYDFYALGLGELHLQYPLITGSELGMAARCHHRKSSEW